ncbi:uncharacterized protein LOC124132938 [Haliotis rufescens]|uniref:uncharacterized protein LOC124132938 n=1 Tax=Haliotis rufescens TaxID=6454 RepID=UPI00201F9D34|nr:uncharacterized protein LOC124132938 [Haliotis rufescens]
MKSHRVFVIVILLGAYNVIADDHDHDHQQAKPDDPQSPKEDGDNTGSDNGNGKDGSWNIPGGNFPEGSELTGNGLDRLTDRFEEMFDGPNGQQGSESAGIKNMFRNLGQKLANLRRSQNANPRGQGDPDPLPQPFASNPCFQSQEKIQEFSDEMSDLLPDADITENVDTGEDFMEGPDEEPSEIIEKMSDFTLECFAPMLDNHTKHQMCRMFSKKSLRSFQKLMSVGMDCVEALDDINNDGRHDDDDDDDDDDDLDLPHQMLLMQHMKKRPFAQWSKTDIDRAFKLAPDTFDDDVIEGLSDNVFESSLQDLGRLVMRNKGSPAMQGALRQRIAKWRVPSRMSSADIARVGAGLAAFDPEDLDDIKPENLAEANLDDVDLDIDDDDPRSLTIGRLMMKGIQKHPSEYTRVDIRRMLPFMKSDQNMVRGLDSGALLLALPDVSKLKFEYDEAHPICRKLRELPDWDEDRDITQEKLLKLGPIMAGCGRDFFDDLPSTVIDGALTAIKDIDFDDTEAGDLLGKLSIPEFKDFTSAHFRQIGKLAKAMRADDIDDLPDSVVAETLDDLDDVDMDDWKRKMFIIKAMATNKNKLPIKLLLLPHFAEALSMDDIETADVQDIKMHLAGAGNIKWRRSLASALFHKIREFNPSLNVDDLHELGSIVTGMSEEDISNMRDDKMNVVNLAAQLADHEDDLSLSQSEAMAVKIRNAFNFDNRNTVEMDETDVLQVAPFLQYLPEAQFNKIKMSRPAREAFLTAMNRGAKSKINREKLIYLMGQGESMLNTQEYRMTDMGTEWDDRKVAKLGGLLQGMPDKVIRRLPGSALMRNIRSFSGAALTKLQAEAIMSKVEEHDSSWNCKRERLAQVGPFLKHLSEDKLKTICKSEMAAAASAVIKGMNRNDEARMERRRQGFMREETMMTTDGEKRVVQLIQESLSSDVATRRRRAVAGPTCHQIKTLGSKAAFLDVTTLSAMDQTEFPNCLQTLGSISGWEKPQLATLLDKTKYVHGPPKTWSVEIVRQAGSILAALTPAELSQIKLFTLDAIASAGKHHLFSQEQLRVGFYRWLNNSKANDISRVSAAEMTSLGNFICAPEPSDILLFSSSAIRGALNVIGGLRSCDQNQLRAYARQTIAIYGGNVGSWNEPVISDMGIVIGGLKANQIRMLRAKQIAVISTEVIPHLTVDVIQSFTATQMNRFSANQGNAFTEEQYRHLSADKKEVVSRKATIAFREFPAGAAGLSYLTPLSAIACLIGLFLRF